MGQDKEPEVISLIKDLQKRMIYLEKKIDMLVNQSAERSSRGRSYTPASPTYRKPRRYGGGRDSRYGTKSSREGQSFGKKRSDDSGGFAKKKKPFGMFGKKRSDKS